MAPADDLRLDAAPRPPSGTRRWRFTAIVLLVLLVLAALVAGAKCYPPNTRVVVLVQGIYTFYDAASGGTQPNGIEPHRFDTLKSAFVAKGYDRAKLLDFSYAGGTVTPDGVWHPNDYDCTLTDRTTDQNLAPLEQTLSDYKRQHPNVHFALVGHSLGGYLAFVEGAREAARPDGAKLGIDVVVTLDAPLKGVSPDKKTILDFIPCQKTYVAGVELVQQKFDPQTPALRQQQSALMAQQGIRLATLGNTVDCLYHTEACLGGTWADDTDTQFLDGEAALTKRYTITLSPLLSHDAIVANATAVQDTVTFVGAP